ncbi:MAG: D-2-hydroxyacid dehydrogenase [Clostridium sp.]|nr:D-2-hydroxyacid dehydrogenase [Clostridium sp.]
MNIVVLDGHTLNPGDLSWDGLKALGTLTVYPRTATETDILDRASDADILLTNKTVINRSTINRLPRLKYIGVLATGYNVVDIQAACERGICVCNIPAYSTESVAQMTFAHLLTITNRVEHYTHENRQGLWNRCSDFSYTDTPLMELAGKRMGLVGLGHIGMRVAQIARAFGMDVCAETSKSRGQLPDYITPTDRRNLFAGCDIVSLHCPLTEHTDRMVNKALLSNAKHGLILINTSRGQLINEADVAQALLSGRLAAYGCDVLSSEPPSIENPLLKAPNTFVTPHIAWATREARTRLMDICINNIKAFLNKKPKNTIRS